jgi:hypothetical protein
MSAVNPAAAVQPEATSGLATVSGTYKLQLTSSKYVSWYATKKCTWGTTTQTYTGSGSQSITVVEFGTATFDGKGTWSVTMTKMPIFDQSKSNASVSITCPKSSSGTPTISGGNAVYDSAAIEQFAGTYTVASTGTLTLIPSGGTASDGLTALLTAYNSSGVATMLLMQDGNQKDNPTSGIAIHK